MFPRIPDFFCVGQYQIAKWVHWIGDRVLKKILVVFGSPHPNGNTNRLVKKFLEPFSSEQFDTQLFDVYAERVSPCIGCGWCAMQEDCCINDAGKRLDRLLRECDLLVIASPVYNLSFPSPLKAVLDRFQRYFEARFSLGKKPPIAKHRLAVLLAAGGSPSEEGVEIMAKKLHLCFSVMNTTLSGTAAWLSTDRGEIGWEKAEVALNRLSLAILSQI